MFVVLEKNVGSDNNVDIYIYINSKIISYWLYIYSSLEKYLVVFLKICYYKGIIIYGK